MFLTNVRGLKSCSSTSHYFRVPYHRIGTVISVEIPLERSALISIHFVRPSRYVFFHQTLPVKPHLAHFVLQFRQTTWLQNLALTSSSNSDNSFRMKLMDSFQELIECVVCVTDNQDWAVVRVVETDSLSVPLHLIM